MSAWMMKRSRQVLLMVLVGQLLGAPARGNPTGGVVTHGSAQIQESAPGRLDVFQQSNRAVIDWRSFSIGKGEETRFQQPSRNSVTLNRVTSDQVSKIDGKLTANGNVYLVNPNGILFGKSARVDVAGLVASGADIRNNDFMAGRDHFSIPAPAGARIVNEGTLTAHDGGLVALVAPTVRNSGVINARLGRVELAGKSVATVDLYGDGLIQLAVLEDSALAGSVSNTGEIHAAGGEIRITADAAGALVDSVINMDGIVEAQTVAQREGRIVLEGGEGTTIQVAGVLDVRGSGAGDQGGQVEIMAGTVELRDGATIDASGSLGGGAVVIGRAGAKREDGLARQTTIDAGAVILADARVAGDGGEVLVDSAERTVFEGRISARGAGGGDGGFVELSGKDDLYVRGDLELGRGGTVLLDPTNLTVGTATGGAEEDATVAADDIRRVLIEGSNYRLIADENVTIDAPIDGRVASGGEPGGGLFVVATNGNANINANVVTNEGAIDIRAGGSVEMSNGAALVVSDGSTGIGSAPITIEATNGDANLQFLATSGEVTVTSGGAVKLGQDLGTLAAPVSSVEIEAKSIELGTCNDTTCAGPGGSIFTDRADVRLVAAAGPIRMPADAAIFVSDGSGSADGVGSGRIELDATGALTLANLVTRGDIDVESDVKVTIAQPIVGASSLDIKAPDVDQKKEIATVGDVSLGNAGGTVTLRRDIFTGGGDLEVRGNVIIDPRRLHHDGDGYLVDENAERLEIRRAIGIVGGEVQWESGFARWAHELAELDFAIKSFPNFDPNAIDDNVNPASTVATASLVSGIERYGDRFSNAVQDKLTLFTGDFNGGTETAWGTDGGDYVVTTWGLTIDTTGADSDGSVEFLGSVAIPENLQAVGPYSGGTETRVFQYGEFFAGDCTDCVDDRDPGRSRVELDPDLGYARAAIGIAGTFEFLDLNIDAGQGAVNFYGNLGSYTEHNGANSIGLWILEAGSLQFAGPTWLNRIGGPATLIEVDSSSGFWDVSRGDRQISLRPTDGGQGNAPLLYLVETTLPSGGRLGVKVLGELGDNVSIGRMSITAGYNPIPTTGSPTSAPASTAPVGTRPAPSFTPSSSGGVALGPAPGGESDGSGSGGAQASQNAEREEREEETAREECGQAGIFAYAIQPVDGAFRPDSRSNGFSVAPFCESYDLLALAPGTGAEFGGLTFVTGDFWLDLDQGRSRTPTPGLRERFGLEAPAGVSEADPGQR